MGKIRCNLTVYFEEPFWVGVFEVIENRKVTAARVVFGAEPKDCELFEYVLRYYTGLHFSPAVDTVVKETSKNPKRIQREARKQTSEAGIGTKSQQAIKLQQEQNKLDRKIRSREKKQAEEMREFELKQQKKREKHRGH
ncbi:MAG: YjdF family protein [Clostridiales bacterium]|nr:YjdF family protein [Clostridiales bacterium]